MGAIVTPTPTAPALQVSSVRHTHASCAHVVLFFAFRRQMRRWSCAASASVDVAGRFTERTSRTRRGASTGSTRVVRTGSLEVGFKRAVAAGLEAKHAVRRSAGGVWRPERPPEGAGRPVGPGRAAAREPRGNQTARLRIGRRGPHVPRVRGSALAHMDMAHVRSASTATASARPDAPYSPSTMRLASRRRDAAGRASRRRCGLVGHRWTCG